MRLLLLALMLATLTINDSVSFLPIGHYGLPKPNSGCPQTKGATIQWTEAFIRVKLQANVTVDVSPTFHWLGVPWSSGHTGQDGQWLQLYFCLRDDGSAAAVGKSTEWPKGQYCVFRNGLECPQGKA